MKLTICELSYLNELILSCINSITCMSLFKNQVTDEELKSILNTHFPIHVEDYNKKVEFVKDAETASGKLNVPQLNTSIYKDNVVESKFIHLLLLLVTKLVMLLDFIILFLFNASVVAKFATTVSFLKTNF